MKSRSFIIFSLLFTTFLITSFYQIKNNSDGPKALSPKESLKTFKLADDYKIELVASEPLIKEPSGICWDQKGQLFVSELHGYNLEGQLEIEDLNKKGEIDTLVRRIEADSKYKKAAEAGIYGTVKKLIDTDKDGEMDKAIVFADHLPPLYGLCAANNGLIVAGQTHVLFLADRNDDGMAEVIDTLFSGFQGGLLERGINAPQWGPEGWIYFGRGWNGGLITGKNLKNSVNLPGSNFRIRADGSAIEPITGSTHTIGHAFTESGESFFINTWKHALYAAPLPWKYLLRNPDASISTLEADASNYATVYPTAAVHPWKLARSNQKEWNNLYSKYGLAESAAGGYFTSGCSPMIYQDKLFPSEFKGNLFICEPAQSLVHRCLVEEKGTEMQVKRAPSEQNSEFLTSTDSWFRPVSLSTAPDGSIYITDMYREIIEDYSAVPRFMQQKYGLKNGMEHGRIWRISPKNAPNLANLQAIILPKEKLEGLLDSPHYWYRQTADRLIRENEGNQATVLQKRILSLDKINLKTPVNELITSLRQQDTLLLTDVTLARKIAALSKNISNERVLLQLALSLGFSKDPTVFQSLTDLARKYSHIRWMPDAILTGVNERAGEMLALLLNNSGGKGELMFEPLGANVAARKNNKEVNDLLKILSLQVNTNKQIAVLKGLNNGMTEVALNESGKKSLFKLIDSKNNALKASAIALAGKLNLTDTKLLAGFQNKAINDLSKPNLLPAKYIEAISILVDAPDEVAAPALINAWAIVPFSLKASVIDALVFRGNRIKYLANALEENKIATTAFLPSQRSHLIEQADGVLRPKIEALFASQTISNKETFYNTYALALDEKIDIKHGEDLFTQMCSVCHKVNNIGVAVGPDLKNSFGNSNQTILRNIIFPNEKIASSYETYTIQTKNKQSFSGVMVSETANGVVLRYAGGGEQTFLRKNILKITSSATSLMPEYGDALSSKDCADIIFWLKETLAKNN